MLCNADLPPRAVALGFTLPEAYIRVVELGLTRLEPWYLLGGEEYEALTASLARQFPDLVRVPFARNAVTGDIAAFELTALALTGRGADHVSILSERSHIAPGCEPIARWQLLVVFEEFWGWFRAAVDDMIEHGREPARHERGFRIALDLTTLTVVDGTITCTIWWEHDGVSFPARGWSDFAAIVLEWWFGAYEDLRIGATRAVFAFMDGPFEIHAVRQDETTVVLTGWDSSRERVYLAAAEVSLDSFGAALLDATEQLLAACAAIGVTTRELMRLGGLAERLRALE